MYANVQLRVHASTEPDQYEWQVVDEFGWIVFRSPNRTEASWWIHIEGLTDYTYTLKRVRVVKRDPLSTHAKAALELIVEKHGRDNHKIACIKDVRAIYGIGLKEAKELVEDYLAEM